MSGGGIQTLLINLLEHFDREKIQYDFLLLDDGEEYELESKLKSLGATVYKLEGIWVRKPQDYFKYCKALDLFFKEHHDYYAVHMNSSSKNFFVLYYAKKYQVKIRIAHSHNTGFQTKSKSQILIGNAFKNPLKKVSTHYFACSEYAGEWLFGKKAVQEGKVFVMPNAIDLDQFCFSQETRERMRVELGVQDNIVIGHVGRFSNQKNHDFLIDIFEEIHKKESNAVLVLAGIGELMDECKKKVENLDLSDCVRFLGFRTDIMNLTQAMDIFLMPSFYEGFPVTGIEAQAVGLPCEFSDTITREAKLIDQVTYVSLQSGTDEWATEVLKLVGTSDRNNCKKVLKERGFDINDIVRYLEDFYLS